MHQWKARISKRAGGEGCPICSGKMVQEGYNDLFSCGPSFLGEWDAERNVLSPKQVTRYSSQKIWWKHDGYVQGKRVPHTWQASVKERMQGNGCPICAGKRIQKGSNDLASTHPELLAEWDYAKNSIQPEELSHGYDKKVWWKHTVIRNGEAFIHSWEASPNSRTNRKSGCPYCANKKVLRFYNDLLTLLPEIAGKWDYERNAPLEPYEVTLASNKKVYWIDRKQPVSICDRTKYLRG